MKVLVAGASGETGRRVVQELCSRGLVVRALVRDPGKIAFPEGVEVVQGDVLQPESLTKALQGCTAVVCATGARPSFDPTGPYLVDYEGTKNLVQAAAQVQHFVLVSSLCVSQLFHPLNLFWLVLFWKKQAEEYLQKSSLTYTIVRPGGLRNEESTFPLVMQGADTLFEGSLSRTQVAQVCVESLLDPHARGKILEIVARADAPSYTWAELFAQIP